MRTPDVIVIGGGLHGCSAALHLALPDEARLLEVWQELVRRNGLREGTLRITITRGADGAREPTLLATLHPIADAAREKAARGWSLVTAQIRHPPASAMPPHLKTLGRPRQREKSGSEGL